LNIPQLSEKLIQAIRAIGPEYLIGKIILFGSRACNRIRQSHVIALERLAEQIEKRMK
jgi:hypothetical protein